MIKRIRFATKQPALAAEAFAAAWPMAVAAAAAAPAGARPERVTAAVVLGEVTGPDPVHDGLATEWFTDAAHLERFEAWLASPGGRDAAGDVEALVRVDASPVLVAEEVPQRGADWLEQRWRDGGEKLQHLAVARRAAGLTPAQLSERWRAHAGRSTAPGGTVVAIPEAARGLAYVQDHPCPRPAGEWAYDALTEVWFDDLVGLRARIEWFEANPPTPDALFRQSWLLAAQEHLVHP